MSRTTWDDYYMVSLSNDKDHPGTPVPRYLHPTEVNAMLCIAEALLINGIPSEHRYVHINQISLVRRPTAKDHGGWWVTLDYDRGRTYELTLCKTLDLGTKHEPENTVFAGFATIGGRLETA